MQACQVDTINPTHRRVLEVLQGVEVASFADIDAAIEDVSSRTLRRVVDKLEEAGLVEVDHEAEYEARDAEGRCVSRWWASMYALTPVGRGVLGL